MEERTVRRSLFTTQCKRLIGRPRHKWKIWSSIEAERFFCPCLVSHCIGKTEILHVAFPAHARHAVQVRLKSVSNEGHFTLEEKQFFVHIFLRIAVGSLSNTISYSLHMRYKQCKLRRRRPVMKGRLFLRSKHFFVCIYPRIAVGSLSNTTWYSLCMRYKQCKLH
jgi:hypothetical protein